MSVRDIYSDDAALLLRLSEGDRSAFDLLYDKYWKKVFNSAYKRLGDTEQAKDIAQDVFVQLWLRGSQYTIENLQAYLFVTVRNGVYKHFEKQNKYATLSDQVFQITDEFDTADVSVLHQEFIDAFNALVDALPAQQRAIFKLRFEKDMSSQEIADELNISVKTVRNHLGRALSTLRTSLLVLQLLQMVLLAKITK